FCERRADTGIVRAPIAHQRQRFVVVADRKERQSPTSVEFLARLFEETLRARQVAEERGHASRRQLHRATAGAHAAREALLGEREIRGRDVALAEKPGCQGTRIAARAPLVEGDRYLFEHLELQRKKALRRLEIAGEPASE